MTATLQRQRRLAECCRDVVRQLEGPTAWQLTVGTTRRSLPEDRSALRPSTGHVRILLYDSASTLRIMYSFLGPDFKARRSISGHKQTSIRSVEHSYATTTTTGHVMIKDLVVVCGRRTRGDRRDARRQSQLCELVGTRTVSDTAAQWGSE